MEDTVEVSCPGCHTEVPLAKKMVCPQCGEDISSLGRLLELPLAYYNEGLKLAGEGRQEDALEKLATAAELKKDFPAPLVVMGKIYAQKGRLAEASHYWERVLAMEPGNAAAQSGLKKAREMMAQEGEEAAVLPGPIPGLPPPTPPVSSTEPLPPPYPGPWWLKLAAAFTGVSFILLLGIMALLWHRMAIIPPPVPSQIALEENLRGIQKQLECLAVVQQERLWELETQLAALQGKRESQSPVKSENRKDPGKSPGAAALIQEEYEIRPGDTLCSLAQRFLASEYRWQEIYRLNQKVLSPNPDQLPVGQKIIILRRAH